MHLRSFKGALRKAYLGIRKPILRVLISTRPVPAIPRSIPSILVISQRRLGDVALEIPALRQLRRAYPKAVVGIVAPAAFHPLLALACEPQYLFPYPVRARSLLAVLADIRKHDWHLAVDLTTDYHLLPAFLASHSRARIRLGFENAGRERFFDIALPFHERIHMMEQFRAPLEILGHESQASFPPFDIPVLALPFPPKNGFRRRIGLHPGATHWTQRWPLAYFADLAREIHEAGDQVLVLGVESERLMLEEIAERSRGAAIPIVCSGDILRFAATLKGLDLLVCNNSGPLHLAGLLGVPTISFMGPTAKERWWPLGSRARVLRQESLPCIGCNLSYCKIRTHACMTGLTPKMAFSEYSRFSTDNPND